MGGPIDIHSLHVISKKKTLTQLKNNKTLSTQTFKYSMLAQYILNSDVQSCFSSYYNTDKKLAIIKALDQDFLLAQPKLGTTVPLPMFDLWLFCVCYCMFASCPNMSKFLTKHNYYQQNSKLTFAKIIIARTNFLPYFLIILS